MEKTNVYDVRCQLGDSGFLLDNGKTSILYDSGFGFTGYSIADNIKKVLGDRPLDYIFLTHSHYDHALATPYIKRRYPDAVVVAGRYAANIFTRDGAKRTMRDLDRKFADTCGVGDYECLVDELKVDVMVDDGDIVKAGDKEFRVLNLPGHTKCSCGFYCEESGLFLSTETLGVYDGDRTIVPSYLVSYQSSMESIERVSRLEIRSMVSPHHGPLDGRQTEYFLSHMRGASEEVAEWLHSLIGEGRSDDEIVTMFKDRFWHGTIRIMYPVDAINLNTSIMINLIRKELG